MKTNPVSWFEIPVKNYERAEKFYTTILGVKLAKNPMGPLTMGVFEGGMENQGAWGAIVLGEGYEPSKKGTSVYLNAGKNMPSIISKIEKAGGEVVLPQTSIGDAGFIAKFADTEGNLVALHASAN